MNEQGDTYDDYMTWAAFYAEQADSFRRTEAATWHDRQARTWFIRDKQNTAAAWARAAEALRQQAQP